MSVYSLHPTHISRLTKNEGSLVYESCTDNNLDELRGTGDPIWLDPDGNTIETTQQILSIPSITRNQAGDYLCQIRSIRNETLSTILTIIVHCELQPIIDLHSYSNYISYIIQMELLEYSSTVKVFPASILTLSCVFNGVPTPSISGIITALSWGVEE